VALSDGQHAVQVDAGALQVASVRSPNEPVSEPYGPVGPFQLGIPWYVWVVLALLITLLGLLIYRASRKYLQRRRWLKEIEGTKGMLSPFNAFNKTLRNLNRQYAWSATAEVADSTQARPFITALYEAFRLYLAQQLLVPAHKWSRKATLKELRRRHPEMYRMQKEGLNRLWQELERAQNPSQALTQLDCAQLLELCRHRADQIWRVVEPRPDQGHP
jgi:hypothetical protein